MRSLLADARARRVMLASVAMWLLLGWLWGDDWLWTVLRAFAATLTVAGVAALSGSSSPVVRFGRVALGVMLGGWCAYVLAGTLTSRWRPRRCSRLSS